MCERFNRNRAYLTKFIYSQTAPFERDEIIREFSKRQNGDIVIDGTQTIAQYLEELAEYGALTYQGGQYQVRFLETAH